MEYSEEKLDKMFVWLTEKLKPDAWFPEGEINLTEEQAIYIERILEMHDLKEIEFSADFSKIRKADLTGYGKKFKKIVK